jgi:hypothetical protein
MNYSELVNDEPEDDDLPKTIKYSVILEEEEFDFGVEPFSADSKSSPLSLSKVQVD